MARVVRRVLERLHEERLAHVSVVRGKLAHLISHATVSVFVRDGKHLVGLQTCLQRDIAERGVDGIFRRREQTRLLQLLIVGAAGKSRYGVEHC